jgi:hypothetical protein
MELQNFRGKVQGKVDSFDNFVYNQEACSGWCFAFDLKILFSGRAMQQLLVSPQEMLVTFDDF